MTNLTMTTYSSNKEVSGRATLIGTDKASIKAVYVITTMFNILKNRTLNLDEAQAKDKSMTEYHTKTIDSYSAILFVIGSNAKISKLNMKSDYIHDETSLVFVRLLNPKYKWFDFSESSISLAGSFLFSEEQSNTTFSHFEIDCYKIKDIIRLYTP